MKEKLQKYAILIIAVGVFIILAIFIFQKKTTPSQPTVLTPTPVPFEFINVYPPEGEREFPIADLAINFTFTAAVDVSTTQVQITPFTTYDISTTSAGTTLSIYPKEGWLYNTEYTIKIEPESKDGQKLTQPIIYQFKPIRFVDSPMTE